MMKKVLGVIAGLGVLALAASLASAQGPGFGWGPGYGHGPGWRTASLTAEEQAQADKLRQEHWADVGALREKIFAKRAELLEARRAGDKAKVEAVGKDLGALYAELGQKRDAHRAEMADLLGGNVPGPGFGPGMMRGFGRGMGRGRGMGYMGYGPGFARGAGCPMWQ